MRQRAYLSRRALTHINFRSSVAVGIAAATSRHARNIILLVQACSLCIPWREKKHSVEHPVRFQFKYSSSRIPLAYDC